MKITGIHHVGYLVPNLDQAVQFFTEVLGFEPTGQQGVLVSSEAGSVTDWFDVPHNAQLRFCFLRAGQSVVELLEGHYEGQNQHIPGNADVGGRHLALQTDNLQAAIQKLQAVPGVRIMQIKDGRFVYVQTPFGMYSQLMAPQ